MTVSSMLPIQSQLSYILLFNIILYIILKNVSVKSLELTLSVCPI